MQTLNAQDRSVKYRVLNSLRQSVAEDCNLEEAQAFVQEARSQTTEILFIVEA
jgi:hypothetical protein